MGRHVSVRSQLPSYQTAQDLKPIALYGPLADVKLEKPVCDERVDGTRRMQSVHPYLPAISSANVLLIETITSWTFKDVREQTVCGKESNVDIWIFVLPFSYFLLESLIPGIDLCMMANKAWTWIDNRSKLPKTRWNFKQDEVTNSIFEQRLDCSFEEI